MFGFELDNVLLQEVGLNALGYLAAGGLSVMLYSSLTKRRWRKMFAEIIEQSAKIVASNNATASNNSATGNHTSPMSNYSLPVEELTPEAQSSASAMGAGDSREFVSFLPGANSNHGYSETAGFSSDSIRIEREVESAVSNHRSAQRIATTNSASGEYTRNRSQVIRLAKEMLESGQSSESVRNELPISESELRLVEIGTRR